MPAAGSGRIVASQLPRATRALGRAAISRRLSIIRGTSVVLYDGANSSRAGLTELLIPVPAALHMLPALVRH